MTAFIIKTPKEFGKRKLQPGKYIWWRGSWQNRNAPAQPDGKRIRVIKDCDPFLSMADGKTVIGSKSQYREHLRQHGKVEVGNDMPPPRQYEPPPVTPVLKDIYQNRGNPDALRRIAESGKI